MRQVLEAAERLAQEEKKFRRKRNEASNSNNVETNANADVVALSTQPETCCSRAFAKDYDQVPVRDNPQLHHREQCFEQETKEPSNPPENELGRESGARGELPEPKYNTIQLPVSTEVAIVLSGRLRDPEVLNTSNLQVNLVVSPSPKKSDIVSNFFNSGEVFLPSLSSPTTVAKEDRNRYSDATNARLLTPSKYRSAIGREFGTQTDLDDFRENSFSYKEMSTKERKESLNSNRRDIEKLVSV